VSSTGSSFTVAIPYRTTLLRLRAYPSTRPIDDPTRPVTFTSVLACFDCGPCSFASTITAQPHAATASNATTRPFTMDRTPSPARRLHTPPAPMHGFSSSYEPYSPRRSTRVAAQRDSHLHHAPKQTSPRARRDVTPTASSKRKATARISNFTLSPPSSPVSSPQHRSPRSMRRTQPDSESEQQPAPTPARRVPSIMPPVRQTWVV
jgi:hypothetical protein